MHEPVARLVGWLGLSGGLLAVGVCGGCQSFDRLAFLGAVTQGKAETRLAPSDRYELVPLHTTGGTRIMALFGRALHADGTPFVEQPRPTVIFFYGNGACVAHLTDVFERLRRLGANVIMPDYPGYGMSEGRPGERSCYEAADAVYAYMLTRTESDRRWIIAGGWSMGGAVAIDLAARQPVAALFTINTFTSGRAVARSWFPALGLFVSSRMFDSEAKISAVRSPILLTHAANDTIVPPAMAGQLAAAARSPVTRVTLENAGHNDVFQTGGDSLWGAIATLLAQAGPR